MGTSNGTFVTDMEGNNEISFVEYSASIEYGPGDQAPMYDLIIGMQMTHDLGVKLNFQERTITIDEIHFPMRNIANLQLKPWITRALRENTCFAQEPVAPAAKPSAWWRFWMLIMRKQIFQP
jgi:hypothetical protein